MKAIKNKLSKCLNKKRKVIKRLQTILDYQVSHFYKQSLAKSAKH